MTGKESMIELLHEVWEDTDGGSLEVCPVSARSDTLRQTTQPKSRLVHQFYAPSYNSAMQLYYDWAELGDYIPVSGIDDHFYTASELFEQQSYLRIRDAATRGST
jgi:hypothetical protein